MTLEGSYSQPAAPAPSGEGISGGGVALNRLRQEALTRAYVYGYIMGNAPQITMALSRSKGKQSATSNIVARESKPSRMLSVLMCLPSNCVQRGGALASPEEIMSGLVDHNTTSPKAEMKLAFPPSAAVAYINALGGRIPEYAPTALGPGAKSKQWTPQEILSNTGGVSFVRIKPTTKKDATLGDINRFKFSLAPENAPRKSLYSQWNVCCLRAVEHTPVKCSTPEETYNINNIAFGGWKFRFRSGETRSALRIACDECPTQIWEQDYEINGEKVPGIGSCFFTDASEVKNAAGEAIAAAQLTYMPWHCTGALRPEVGPKLASIVLRKYRPAEGTRKEAMVPVPVLYSAQPDHKMFAPYKKFTDSIISEGFISAEKLKTLGGRTSTSKKSKTLSLSPEQKTALQNYIKQDNVVAEVGEVQLEAANRLVLEEFRR